MSAVQHTPGPWLVEGSTVYALMHHGWNRGVEVLKNRFWARINHDQSVTSEEAAATLSLIAAAPDLLAALKRCRFDSLNMSLEDLEFCLAAIAKAEGAGQ